MDVLDTAVPIVLIDLIADRPLKWATGDGRE